MKIKQLLVYILLLTTFTNLAYAELNFISVSIDTEQTKDKIAYSITEFENLEQTDKFKLEIYANDQLIDDSCLKPLNFKKDTFFKKLICETNTLAKAQYTFVGMITRNGEIIDSTITKYSLSDNSKSSLNYKILENETLITIQVESDLETYQVEHYIPKEIIAELTLENQNELIESELGYIILDADPIIAWNIDESPKTIEYKIKKSSNSKDLENLGITINSTSQAYTYLSYVLYILILLIIGVILKPIFIKKNKTKKQN
jgi:hypothetical protein